MPVYSEEPNEKEFFILFASSCVWGVNPHTARASRGSFALLLPLHFPYYMNFIVRTKSFYILLPNLEQRICLIPSVQNFEVSSEVFVLTIMYYNW